MEIISKIEELQKGLCGAKSIGFVPTMGALHSGHIDLVRRAVEQNKVVVVSVFVNPTQFNDSADLEKYPRTLQKDAEMLEKTGATILFAPEVKEIYPDVDMSYTITDQNILPLVSVMEGKHRAGHFDGVVQVVSKLFDIVKPHRAYFGEKDFQQLAIIRAMVRSWGLPIEIVPCPTVREESGLAMSSRNTLLSDNERSAAANIYKVIKGIRDEIEQGSSEYEELASRGLLDINKNSYLCAEYLEIVDRDTLQKPQSGAEVRVCVAVRCGQSVRLIDNC